jgi:hypothetical protein
MTNFPFQPTEPSVKKLAFATSDATLAAWDYNSGGSVRVANKSSNIAYIQIALTGIDANSTTGMPVLPGSVELFTCGSAITTVSTYAAATATLFFTQGQGGV